MPPSSNVSRNGIAGSLDGARERIGQAVRSVAAELDGWIEACTDYYSAAAIYEQLSRLSDAELSRRGLSRATLASEIASGCDRTSI